MLLLGLLAVWLTGISTARAAPVDQMTEDKVKVAFVYNFIKFVQWPDEAPDEAPDETPEAGPVRLCVLGAGTVADLMKDLEGKSVHGRKLQVILDQTPSGSTDTPVCHALYLAGTCSDQKMAQALQNLKRVPVLTVSDKRGFASQGGMIELFRKGRKLRFKINLAAAREANLKISSKLLKLAMNVID